MLSSYLILFAVLCTVESSFKNVDCPSDGYFPALNTCTAYNICFSRIPTKMTCGKFQVYSPKTKSCVLMRGTNKCFHFICNKLTKRYSIYPGDTSLYAICFKNKVIALQQCFSGLFFDEKQGACTFQCQKEGFVADPYECTKFRECTKLGPKFKWVQRTCPKGSWFNPAYNKCSVEDTDNCFSPSTTSPIITNGTVTSGLTATSISTIITTTPTVVTPDLNLSTSESSQLPSEDNRSSQFSTSDEVTLPTLFASTSTECLYSNTTYPSTSSTLTSTSSYEPPSSKSPTPSFLPSTSVTKLKLTSESPFTATSYKSTTPNTFLPSSKHSIAPSLATTPSAIIVISENPFTTNNPTPTETVLTTIQLTTDDQVAPITVPWA